MNDTVNAIHTQMDRRFSNIKNAFGILQHDESVKELITEFDNVYTAYYQGVIWIIDEDMPENDRIDLYMQAIHTNNTADKIKSMSNRIAIMLKNVSDNEYVSMMSREGTHMPPLPYGHIGRSVDHVQPAQSSQQITASDQPSVGELTRDLKTRCEFTHRPHSMPTNLCSCGNKMSVRPTTSEMVCEICGNAITIYGTSFAETQSYSADGVRNKHGSYDIRRHCRLWLDRIQAKEADDVSSCIASLERCCKRDRIELYNLKCESIRKYLKETKQTKFNNNVALIRKQMGGLVPPQLTAEEESVVMMHFDKCNEIFNKIKSNAVSNNPYYPYFMFKIIESILSDSDSRKMKLLSCIHLQSLSTLIKNDKHWQSICSQYPAITFIPTDPAVFNLRR